MPGLRCIGGLSPSTTVAWSSPTPTTSLPTRARQDPPGRPTLAGGRTTQRPRPRGATGLQGSPHGGRTDQVLN